MTVGNKSNNDDCEGLSHFGWRYIVLLLRCVLRGDAKNSREYFLLSTLPHPVFLVKSCGVAIFQKCVNCFVNYVTKCVCVLMIDVCVKFSESHMSVFLGRLLCTSAYRCIFIYIVV